MRWENGEYQGGNVKRKIIINDNMDVIALGSFFLRQFGIQLSHDSFSSPGGGVVIGRLKSRMWGSTQYNNKLSLK